MKKQRLIKAKSEPRGLRVRHGDDEDELAPIPEGGSSSMSFQPPADDAARQNQQQQPSNGGSSLSNANSLMDPKDHTERTDDSSVIDERPPSLMTGTQTYRMSVFANDGDWTADRRNIETPSGRSVLVVKRRRQRPMPKRSIDAHKEDSIFFDDQEVVLRNSMMGRQDLQTNDETGLLGGAWRGVLKRLLLYTFDPVNARQLGRILQLSLPFLTAYESYILSNVIESLDRRNYERLSYALDLAFMNRNVSRIMVQNVGARYDFWWHWSTAVSRNRFFDALGQFPIIGITRFPATENFPSTRNHALASIFRVLLGEGNWITRVVTGGREGLVTDNPNNLAQNLAAESNGFELANRNQYGTHFGRIKTNQFRLAHRLPTDESVVRTFVSQPMSTMTNNGVVHTLRQLSNHWHDMLQQEFGNFAHQRMEQLDPFETLRFHMPQVLVLLASLRGRNNWDNRVLGPMITKLQNLSPSLDAKDAKRLAEEVKDTIAVSVSGGVPSVLDPFRSWLEAIMLSCDEIEKEVPKVYDIVASVEIGIRLGFDIMTQVKWKVPSDDILKRSILDHIRGEHTSAVNVQRIRRALQLTTPRDKRTLIELVEQGLANTKPAKLLLNRVKTLLQRELRREALNEAIRKLSFGEYIVDELVEDQWYWLEEQGKVAAHIYIGLDRSTRNHGRFLHVDSGFERMVDLSKVKAAMYIPVAESITRAQKAFMTIELEHGKKFAYNAFMEFSHLRIALGRLAVVGQMACEELDNARLNLLKEIQRYNKMQVAPDDLEPGVTYFIEDHKTKTFRPFTCQRKYGPRDLEYLTLASNKIVRVLPQNVLVVGGGPTGLTMAIHCTENCLQSGGVMKLYEARDAFEKAGSTFERSQIVRLDSRWIALLRFHCGTAFEDHYISLSGETDSQLGNTLPTQGFVEITIKDLENMLHVEVSRLWSRGLLTVYTNSKAHYDLETNSLTKFGENLKVDDLVLRRIDPTGKPSKEYHSWRVAELSYTKSLGIDDLRVGEDYGVYIRSKQAVLPFKLVAVDLESKEYNFRSLTNGVDGLRVHAQSLPSVYPAGTETNAHANVRSIVFESLVKEGGYYVRDELDFDVVKRAKFTLDVGNTHVVEAIGKPHDSSVHFLATTTEPYGTLCLQGLKVSMGMHNFGEKRWGSGIVDDIRSFNDQNTRIVGDFTKMVRVPPIMSKMFQLVSEDSDWQIHFERIILDSAFPELQEFDPIIPKIIQSCEWLAENSKTFRRQTLQTRFFETGDTFYLGMEFNREYAAWRKSLVHYITASLTMRKIPRSKKEKVEDLRQKLAHHVDRLFFTACLATLRKGDVYNPGARHRVPDLHLIRSYKVTTLGNLPVGESFRLNNDAKQVFEILAKFPSHVVVRNVEGYVFSMKKTAPVNRESNLTRGPDGHQESRVALSSFSVGHFVNFRCMRKSNAKMGYVFAFAGDGQATPHFMRYSGLTGAAINAMCFNNFIREAIDKVSFEKRFRGFSQHTNWSNGEVLKRGCGSNYGEDGFLRPGFSYRDGVAFLYSKAVECLESDQSLSEVFSRDWRLKFAANFVPRGLELNNDFLSALSRHLHRTVIERILCEVAADKTVKSGEFEEALRAHLDGGDMQTIQDFWPEFLDTFGIQEDTRARIQRHVDAGASVTAFCEDVVRFAKELHLDDRRISSEMFNQPKPVDSIIDDFAVEAQNFANSLTISAAFAAGAIAFHVISTPFAEAFSVALGVLNIAISFGTMANVGRYKIRNEEARLSFFDEKLPALKRAVFTCMDRKARESFPQTQNPFIDTLEATMDSFRRDVLYYGHEEPVEINAAFHTVKFNIHDVESLRAFQRLLIKKFVVETYQANSYIQESLVRVVKTLDLAMASLQPSATEESTASAVALFTRITKFESDLDDSMQRGPVKWGFVKKRDLRHWDIVLAFRYFASLFFVPDTAGRCRFGTIETETHGILEQTRLLASLNKDRVLGTNIRDLETLYWATRESGIASLIFLSGFFVFVASVIFSIARIFDIDRLEEFAFWAFAASSFGAILATFHFVRKLGILVKLWHILGQKRASASTRDQSGVSQIRSATTTQILLTLIRLVAATTSAVALPFALAEQGYHDRLATPESLPIRIAVVSVICAIGATVAFFVVEFQVRYNLSPILGPFVCDIFREEIEGIYHLLASQPSVNELVERDIWEYTAREFLHKYRFDTVFAADRFGQLLQYIQAGMESRIKAGQP